MDKLLFFLPIIIIIWFIIFSICKSQARNAIIEKGFNPISIRWAPFGYGIFSGVYFSKDEVESL